MFDHEEYVRLLENYRIKPILDKGHRNSPSNQSEITTALEELRKFLDSNKMRMPLPKYKYDINDKTTHRFIQSKAQIVTNPHFRFTGAVVC